MTNNELNQIKTNINLISNNILRMMNTLDDLTTNINGINDQEEPEKFQEAALSYSQAKNQFTSYLLEVVDNLSLTLIEMIEYLQVSPGPKLWVPK
jgi:septal ring factor EnvC (AmiA/AmiB activator)